MKDRLREKGTKDKANILVKLSNREAVKALSLFRFSGCKQSFSLYFLRCHLVAALSGF